MKGIKGRLVSLSELARLLGIGRTTLYRYLERGIVQVERVGSKVDLETLTLLHHVGTKVAEAERMLEKIVMRIKEENGKNPRLLKRGGVWYLAVTGLKGTVKFSLKTRNRNRAVALLAKVKNRLEGSAGESRGKALLEAFFRDKGRLVAPEERKEYERAWRRWAETGEEEDFYSKWVSEGFSPETVKKWLRYLKSVYRWARENRFCKEVPRSLRRPSSPATGRCARLITDEEVKALAEAAREIDEELERLIIFAATTGLRRSELAAMTWDWVKISSNGVVLVFREKKTKKIRSKVLPEVAAEILSRQREKSSNEGKVWRWSESTMSRLVSRAAKKAGVDVTLHDLRRYYVTKMILSGANLELVHRLAGHSEFSTTERFYVMAVAATHEAKRCQDQAFSTFKSLISRPRPELYKVK